VNLISIESAPKPRRGPSIERLTPRERQVVELAHLRNADIAAELGISLATVKTLLSRAMEKAGAETRTQAYALLVDRRAA
jgi:DNA-binding CsgD family transcriptional regulator